jgi:polar amino acid transport system substrate-binding protein
VITRQGAGRALRLARWSALGAGSLAVVATLAACGSGSASTGSAGPAAPAVGAAASAASYPTQDVVSSITADPALRAELPADARSAGTLTLGTTILPGSQGLPHAAELGGQDVGVDVDLRNAVGKLLGIKWQVDNSTFATIVPGVQNGKYDVGQGNFGVTAAREKVVDFATYLTDGQAFLGRSSLPANKITTLDGLCGLVVATTPGSTFQQILTDGAAKCAAAGKKPYTVQYFSDSGPIFLGLANGKVDVYFGPTLSLQYDAKHVPNTKFLGQISSTPVGFVTGKGSPAAKALRDAVNKLIDDGDYAKILGKWGVTSSGISASALNPKPNL